MPSPDLPGWWRADHWPPADLLRAGVGGRVACCVAGGCRGRCRCRWRGASGCGAGSRACRAGRHEGQGGAPAADAGAFGGTLVPPGVVQVAQATGKGGGDPAAGAASRTAGAGSLVRVGCTGIPSGRAISGRGSDIAGASKAASQGQDAVTTRQDYGWTCRDVPARVKPSFHVLRVR
jgi:hypothetical protein